MKYSLTWRWWCLLPALTSPMPAGQREVVNGFVSPVDNTAWDYLFHAGPYRDPRMALVDDLQGDAIKSFSRARLEIIREVSVTGGTLQDRLGIVPAGMDAGIALRSLPSELMWPGKFPLSPERWAGQNTGLHPNLHETHPFEVTGPADFDEDAVPDEMDLFPADPAENTDNDHDGSGDNGDPDDDNDGMPDTYETENGLQAFTADADDDPDNDGYSNGEECAAGTGAQNGGSFFQISNTTPGREGFLIEWDAIPGRSYEVWHHPDLEPRGAKRLENDLRVSSPSTLQYTTPIPGPRDYYFIRVILDPLP